MDTNQSEPQNRTDESLRVLLVDDARIILDRLVRALHAIDRVEVIGTSATSSSAVEQVKALKPDLVVLDISLYESNGWDVLRYIVADAPRVSVYVFSNDASDSAKDRFMQAGANQFFDKSLDFAALLAAVRQLVQTQQCQRD